MKINKRKLNWAVAVALFLINIILFKNSPFLKNVSAYLSKKPETLTELYFTDHLNLPKEIDSTLEYMFEFTIHNLEYQTLNYHYEVTAINENTIDQLGNGSLELDHDGSITIPQKFRLKPGDQKTQILVKLIDQNQSIHFWVET